MLHITFYQPSCGHVNALVSRSVEEADLWFESLHDDQSCDEEWCNGSGAEDASETLPINEVINLVGWETVA